MTGPPTQEERHPTQEDHYFVEGPRPRTPWLVRIGKFIGIVALIVLVGFFGAAAAERLAGTISASPTVTTIPAGQDVAFTVPLGSTASDIGTLLQSAGLITDGSSFERTVIIQGVSEELKAGAYTMTGGMTTNEIISELVAGPPTPDTFRLTVIEGLRIEEMLDSIAAQTDYTVDELAAPLLDGTVSSPFLPAEIPDGAPPLTAWEGLLFPATYDFVVGAEVEQIMGRLVGEMNTRMTSVNWSGLEEAGLTPYEGLIIASLIEKEAKLEEDRPLISSVIHNRLDGGIALQIDATVIYALGENPGRILFEDLEIDSPWNTYQNAGLPPTPIGGVRATSLTAAAEPTETEFFYYVLVDADGRHGFSETLEEHNAKVAQAREDGVLP